MYPLRFGAAALMLAAVVACTDKGTENEGCASACPEGLVCDSRSGTCVPVAPADAGCQSDLDCTDPTPRCDTGTGACAQCLEAAHCASGACDDGLCLPVPESCSVAQEIQVSSDTTVIEATTEGRSNDAHPTCTAGGMAPDLVYELVVSEPSRLQVVARPQPNSPIRPVLELRSACASLLPNESLACRWMDSPQTGAVLDVEVPVGRYYLWVDADFGTAGAFRLEVTGHKLLEGDSCVAPTIVLPTSSSVSLEGDTREMGADTQGFCGGAGRDVVYAIIIDRAQRFRATVTTKTAGFRPVVYLRRPDACDDPSGAAQLDCGFAQGNASAVIDVPRIEPGVYYLFVDGDLGEQFQPTAGEFQLRVEHLPPLELPPNNTCEGATPLELPANGQVLVTGDTSSAVSEATSACEGSGPDVVYTFTLDEPRQVHARVMPEMGAYYAPVLFIRTACDSEAPEALVACDAASQYGGAASVIQGNLPAGTYFLWVDGVFQTRGKFTLTVDTKPPATPPSNDSCKSPAPLVATSGTLTLTGSTLGAGDHATGCEVPQGSPSLDVVYELVVPVHSSLSLDVQATQGSPLRPVVYLDRAGVCGMPEEKDRLFCAWGDPYASDRVVHTIGSLASGTYYLWIDGDYTTNGPFSLKATLGAPVPAPVNDECSSAHFVGSVPGSTSGDTRNATDSTAGFCLPYATGSGEGAGDVAFTFETTTTRTVTLKVVPDPVDGKLFRPAIYVRGPDVATCGSEVLADQIGCAVAPALGASAMLTLQNLSPGTWTVWVDGVGKTTGKFSLSLQ